MALLALAVASRFSGGEPPREEDAPAIEKLVQYSQFQEGVRSSAAELERAAEALCGVGEALLTGLGAGCVPGGESAAQKTLTQSLRAQFARLHQARAAAQPLARAAAERADAALAELETLSDLYKARDAARARHEHYVKKVEGLKTKRLNLASTQNVLQKIDRNDRKLAAAAAKAEELAAQVKAATAAVLDTRFSKGYLAAVGVLRSLFSFVQGAGQAAVAAASTAGQLEALCNAPPAQVGAAAAAAGARAPAGALSGKIFYGTQQLQLGPQAPLQSAVQPAALVPASSTSVCPPKTANSSFFGNREGLRERSRSFFAEKFGKFRRNQGGNPGPIRRRILSRRTPTAGAATPRSPFPDAAPEGAGKAGAGVGAGGAAGGGRAPAKTPPAPTTPAVCAPSAGARTSRPPPPPPLAGKPAAFPDDEPPTSATPEPRAPAATAAAGATAATAGGRPQAATGGSPLPPRPPRPASAKGAAAGPGPATLAPASAPALIRFPTDGRSGLPLPGAPPPPPPPPGAVPTPVFPEEPPVKGAAAAAAAAGTADAGSSRPPATPGAPVPGAPAAAAAAPAIRSRGVAESDSSTPRSGPFSAFSADGDSETSGDEDEAAPASRGTFWEKFGKDLAVQAKQV